VIETLCGPTIAGNVIVTYKGGRVDGLATYDEYFAGLRANEVFLLVIERIDGLYYLRYGRLDVLVETGTAAVDYYGRATSLSTTSIAWVGRTTQRQTSTSS
jgi:hypothetical protein